MNVYAIIVIYNGMHRDWIQKCFSSLRNSQYPLQVIAIDNNSKDESVKYIEQNFPEIELIKSDKNLGFGGANNLGIKLALEKNADAVFLLNQDAWIEPKTISELVRISQNNEDFGIISPLQLDGTGERLENGFSYSISSKFNKDFFSDFVLKKQTKELYETTESYAASWFITKKCLKIVGGFNPSFFHYGEDDNYCRRVTFKNLKIGVTPNTFICHDTYEKPKSNFFNYFEIEKRQLTTFHSEPNKIIDSKKKLIFRHRMKTLKYFFLFDFKFAKINYDILNFISNDYDKIIENKMKTISKDEYIFLK